MSTTAIATATAPETQVRTEATTRPPATYAYDPSAPMPIEADTEALAMLAKARGPLALAELDQAGKVLAGEIRFRHRQMTAGSIREHLPAFQDLVARARVYGARAVAVARLLKAKAPAPAAIPEIPDLVRILGSSIEGQDLRGQLAASAAAARTELGSIESELQDLTAAASDESRFRDVGVQSWRVVHDRRLGALASQTRSYLAEFRPELLARPAARLHEFATDATQLVSTVNGIPLSFLDSSGFPQDRFLTAVTAGLAARKALAARLAALEGDRARTTAVVAERVGQAITAAGGPDSITAAIVAAEVLAGCMPASLASYQSKVAALESAHATITSDFDRLALAIGDSLNPPAAASLRARQAQVALELKAARAELLANHRRVAGELLDQAAAGDESARAAIARLTDVCPDAFPAGFAAAIAAAEFGQAAAAELANALSI